MKTHVTVVPDDNIILVDLEGLVFEYPIPDNIHAIQWHNGKGEIEYKDTEISNKEADYEKDILPYVLLWEAEKERIEEEETHRDLDVERQLKHEQVNTIRNRKEQDYFVWKGYPFDSDSDSAQRLSLAYQSKIEPITWTLYNNENIELSNSDLQEVIKSFATWSGYVHNYAAVLKNQIDSPEIDTLEKLDDIDIISGWLTPEQVALSTENTNE